MVHTMYTENQVLRQTTGYVILYFDGNLRANLKELDENFEDLNFNDMDNIDALKIALYYFANRVFNGRKDRRTLNSLLLNNIDDLEYFKSLPCAVVHLEKGI